MVSTRRWPPSSVRRALPHNLKHNPVLHERNLVLTVVFHDRPWVPDDERVQVQPLPHRFWRVTLNDGFMDSPDVPPFETTWFMSRHAGGVDAYFRLPGNAVVALGPGWRSELVSGRQCAQTARSVTPGRHP